MSAGLPGADAQSGAIDQLSAPIYGVDDAASDAGTSAYEIRNALGFALSRIL